MSKRPLRGIPALGSSILAVFLSGPTWAQSPTVNLPKPNADGWIKIYRGDNPSDFSVYTGNGAPAQEGKAFGDPFFHQGGDTVRTDGSPNGQLIFKQNFSHYIMEVQLRWPGNLGNTGVMTKIQWSNPGQGGGLPQCIECQGDPNQGMGQIWSLGSGGNRPWITFRGKTHERGAQVDSTRPPMDFGNSGANCIVGFPGWMQPRPTALSNAGWVTIRAEVRGRDTSRHFIDGQKVMEYWNPRLAPSNNANSVTKYLVEGMVSIQSEGTTVWYRNWRIKLLPEDPLYASLYTPVTLAPRPDARERAPLRLGFQDGVLSVLSEGRPATSLMGRRIGNPRHEHANFRHR